MNKLHLYDGARVRIRGGENTMPTNLYPQITKNDDEKYIWCSYYYYQTCIYKVEWDENGKCNGDSEPDISELDIIEVLPRDLGLFWCISDACKDKYKKQKHKLIFLKGTYELPRQGTTENPWPLYYFEDGKLFESEETNLEVVEVISSYTKEI